MAAPADKTIKDLSGKWVMSKELSDDFDAILQMQGVGWMMRKIISMATITLTISEYIEEGTNLTHIDIQQVATGGISGTTEKRTLDWEFRDHTDGIFGAVRGKSRWVLLADVDQGPDREWLTKGWLDESGGEHVQSHVVSRNAGWTAEQIWGFEEINETRYHTRHVVVRKEDDWKQARLVYNFQGTG
ncbi:hypothetical protein MMC11_005950 [Xylographa trunciseda]|nr:hypothetical protein [Xylographa trunciseda]